MLKDIYIIVRKDFSGHIVVDSYDAVQEKAREGDLVYEVREAYVAVRDGIRMEEIPQKKLSLGQHNYN